MPNVATGGAQGRRILDLRNMPVSDDQPEIVLRSNLGVGRASFDSFRQTAYRPMPAATIPAPKRRPLLQPTKPSRPLDFRQPAPLASSQFAAQLETVTTSNPRSFIKPLAIGLAAICALAVVARPVSTSRRPAGTVSKAVATAPAAIHAGSAAAGPTKAPASVTNPQLQQMLATYTDSAGANFGIYVKDLKTGAAGTSAPDVVFKSASLYKLFVATEIYKRVDTGNLQLGASAGSGTGLTIGQCLNYMITVSDNDCGRALGETLNWGSQDPALANLGFTHTTLADPQQTSASDVALLLERLYRGTLLGPTSSQQFIDLLKAQQINNRLPAGLPDGTVVAHKTGDLDSYMHDAGIIYAPKTDYLVVVMSGSWSNLNNAPGRIAELSAKLYQFFNQ